MRQMGEWILDLEQLIGEAVDDHDLQRGDILSLVYNYITVHCPGAVEVYVEDESNPVYYYGPYSGLKYFNVLGEKSEKI